MGVSKKTNNRNTDSSKGHEILTFKNVTAQAARIPQGLCIQGASPFFNYTRRFPFRLFSPKHSRPSHSRPDLLGPEHRETIQKGSREKASQSSFQVQEARGHFHQVALNSRWTFCHKVHIFFYPRSHQHSGQCPESFRTLASKLPDSHDPLRLPPLFYLK